jgi:Tfp pilus assembly PilM family ATPase
MVRKDSNILGIDLHDEEIRVVQIGSRSNKPFLGKVGRAPMPEGAVLNGRILHVGPVAVALRLLLNSMGITSAAKAVVGVLGDSTTLRTLSVPPVPDNELPTIIAGEVSHYNLVHSEGGAYIYLRLNPPSRSGGGDSSSGQSSGDKRETWLDPDATEQNPSVVTVMAVEEDILLSLDDTITQANVNVEAMEPSQYAMYRTIMSNAGPTPTLFALMVNPANTDIAFIHKGLIVGYRRIDIGSRVLTLQYTAGAGGTVPAGAAPEERASGSSSAGSMNKLAVHSLSLEVQRTLNYYQREFPAALAEDNVYLAIDDSRLDELAKELTFELGVNVETVQPGFGDPSSQGGDALSPIYAAAFGLATQGQIMTKVPRLDLFTKQRAGVKKKETRRNFTGSIIISAVAVVLGIAGYMYFHRQIDAIDAQINETNAKATVIRNETNKQVQLRHTKEQQFNALRSEGAPVTALMDYISTGITKGTGLQSVTISNDLTVNIVGQSSNETLMIVTSQQLQQCPLLSGLTLVNFHALQGEEGDGVGWQLTGHTVSINHLKLPEEPKPATVNVPNVIPGSEQPVSGQAGAAKVGTVNPAASRIREVKVGEIKPGVIKP